MERRKIAGEFAIFAEGGKKKVRCGPSFFDQRWFTARNECRSLRARAVVEAVRPQPLSPNVLLGDARIGRVSDGPDRPEVTDPGYNLRVKTRATTQSGLLGPFSAYPRLRTVSFPQIIWE